MKKKKVFLTAARKLLLKHNLMLPWLSLIHSFASDSPHCHHLPRASMIDRCRRKRFRMVVEFRSTLFFRAPKATSPWENQISQRTETERESVKQVLSSIKYRTRREGKWYFHWGMAQVKKWLVVWGPQPCNKVERRSLKKREEEERRRREKKKREEEERRRREKKKREEEERRRKKKEEEERRRNEVAGERERREREKEERSLTGTQSSLQRRCLWRLCQWPRGPWVWLQSNLAGESQAQALQSRCGERLREKKKKRKRWRLTRKVNQKNWKKNWNEERKKKRSDEQKGCIQSMKLNQL